MVSSTCPVYSEKHGSGKKMKLRCRWRDIFKSQVGKLLSRVNAPCFMLLYKFKLYKLILLEIKGMLTKNQIMNPF